MQKICIVLEPKEEIFLKKIAMGQDLNLFIHNYLKHNLFSGSFDARNEGSRYRDETSKDEFDVLIEKLNYFGITQDDLSNYFGTTQPTVSRFLKAKSKKSILYNAVFLKLDTVLYNIYFNKVLTSYDNIVKLPIYLDKKINVMSSDKNLEFILKALFVKMYNDEINKHQDISEKFNKIVDRNRPKIAYSSIPSLFKEQKLEAIFESISKLYEELFLQ